MLYTMQYAAPLGALTLASNGESLVGLWVVGQKYYGGELAYALEHSAHKRSDLPIFDTTTRWLNHYFAREKPMVQELPLAPAGGAFRQTVWRMLREIPYGETVSYGALAQRIALQAGKQTMSAQAVGGAVGHNPISLIIPCHRVVGAHGSLVGYASGMEKKIWLLAHEGVELMQFTVPKKGTAL